MAASMMSASAIASGGGVAAGGVVATLQSIGAVGIAPVTAYAVGAVTSGMTALALRFGRGSKETL